MSKYKHVKALDNLNNTENIFLIVKKNLIYKKNRKIDGTIENKELN